MPWMTPAAIFGSSLLSSNAASSGAESQANAANRSADLSNAQYQQTRQDQMPFMQAGYGALNNLIPLASNYQKFGQAQFQQDPGYAFRLSEGQKALDNQAAARGGLISGNALKAAQSYGQDMGSQEYTNAFNRYQTERQAQLNPLQSLAGMGQTTAQGLGASGAANANAMGNYYTGGAAASAAGRMGAANAFTGGLSTYMNYNQGNNLIKALRQSPTGYSPSSGYGSFGGASGTFGEGEY